MYLGLDIGTTSICAVVLDGDGKIVYTTTRANDTHIKSEDGARMQDAEEIFSVCETIYKEVLANFKIKSVGVSGQMHGIIYINSDGFSLSPLYSWQDERGNLPYLNSTYAKTLSEKTGYKMATGFGCTSLYYDTLNEKIPDGAVSFCTVGDYVAMRLVRRKSPLINETNAASLGLYDIKNHTWDKKAILSAGLSESLFPEVSSEVTLLGVRGDGAAIYTAIGDNQASVYGAEQSVDSLIINIGTGSQISVITEEYITPPDECEIRPYFNGKYLALGCALCGGYSYKLLRDFYNSIFGGEEKITYEDMNEWAKEAYGGDTPSLSPLFRGTRTNPSLRATLTDISDTNFNARALTLATLKGISGELKNFYNMLTPVTRKRDNLIASGNAIRMNPTLRRIIEEDYGLSLKIPEHKEEAAFGAALVAAEVFEGKNLKKFIRYTR